MTRTTEADLFRGYGVEDDLLATIGDALTLTGRPWHHDRRSDQALTMGATGFPDVIGVVGDLLVAYELKSSRGHVTPEQLRWVRALSGVRKVDARVIRPDDLDGVLEQLVRGRGSLT